MGTCVFNTEDIKRCVTHAIKSKKWRHGYDESQPARPALMFVHDDGVYCMSSGLPRDMVGKDRSFCAYAEGCDPTKDEDFYEESRFLVGGDDFVEVLDVDDNTLLLCDEFGEMVIEVSENELSVVFRKPKSLKKVV
jgi:hypothetical protein